MSWIYFIGHVHLGYSDDEIGKMTLSWLMRLYDHYKQDYDFRLAHVTYKELSEAYDHQNECLPW